MDLMDTFTFTPNRSNDAEEFHHIRAAAVKSLERIQSIYEQIMAPSGIYSSTPYFEFEELRTPPESPISERGAKNRRAPSKAVVDELCGDCRNVISRCNDCRFCLCSDFENNSNHREDIRHLRRISSEPIKVTVPRPFALSHMDVSRRMATEEKMRKLREELKNEAERETRVEIRSRPVPKNTSLPLYEKMVEEGERRKALRKEISLEVNRRPVPRDGETSEVPEEKPRTFRAKPIPKHILSDRVSKRLKHKEEIRKMMIAQRAEETLMSARSPFSERPRRTRSEINLDDVVRKVDSEKNVSAITDRLYVRKCRETMDDWNRKVSEFDGRRERSLPLSTLPFSFFPIRMSHAAMSREKQIR